MLTIQHATCPTCRLKLEASGEKVICRTFFPGKNLRPEDAAVRICRYAKARNAPCGLDTIASPLTDEQLKNAADYNQLLPGVPEFSYEKPFTCPCQRNETSQYAK